MSTKYAHYVSTRESPQSEPIFGSNCELNNAGGYAFAVDHWGRLDRFLILGTEEGTYYIGEQKLTVQNAESVRKCIEEDGIKAVLRIVDFSESGRAPKNDSAVFALAMAASLGQLETRNEALNAIGKVCRTGTHLFQFVKAVLSFRGWGRGLRRAVNNWYAKKTTRELAYQLTKYQNREGWSHRDVIRLAHLNLKGDSNQAIRWALGKRESFTEKDPSPDSPLAPILAFEAANHCNTANEVVQLIRKYRLVRECVPTRWLNSPDVWEALLEEMPLMAMVRNLATMTRLGVLQPKNDATTLVINSLSDSLRLRKARLHPLAFLTALRTYSAGYGVRGQSSWSPIQEISDALDQAFYKAFEHNESTGKRWLLALDVSGSMAGSMIAGVPNFSAREAAAAMALVTAATEPEHRIIAFTGKNYFQGVPNLSTISHGTPVNGVEPLNIDPKIQLNDVINFTNRLPMGSTDCALPMLYALGAGIKTDIFVIYTDNETWVGDIHPVQALKKYREVTGIPAKMVVVGMVSNGFSIADPTDSGMVDIVGFDTNIPKLLNHIALNQAK